MCLYDVWFVCDTECTGPNGGLIFGSLLFSIFYVVFQHVMVQNSYGTFGLLFFFTQTAALVMNPWSLARPFEVLSSSLVFFSSSSSCPFYKAHFGHIVYDFMRPVASFIILGLM